MQKYLCKIDLTSHSIISRNEWWVRILKSDLNTCDKANYDSDDEIKNWCSLNGKIGGICDGDISNQYDTFRLHENISWLPWSDSYMHSKEIASIVAVHDMILAVQGPFSWKLQTTSPNFFWSWTHFTECAGIDFCGFLVLRSTLLG